jgi:hypothetical protein
VSDLSVELAQLNADILPTQAAAAGFAGSGAFAFGRWTGLDSGEAIALDVPYDEYARNQASYSAAFAAAVADCLNVTADTVEVSAFQSSSVGTVVVFFAVILQAATSTSSAVVSQNFVSIKSLFEASAVTPLSVGSPALPPLIHALNAFGLTVSGAYYNDQLPIPPPSPSPPPPNSPPVPGPPPPLNANFACGLNSVEGLGHLPLAHPISGRRMLLEDERRRRMLACGSGCVAPKLDPGAVASETTALELKFAMPFTSYGAVSSGYAIAYGVCVALGCNYRNVTARYATGNLDATDVVFAVTFFAWPGSANLTLYPAALAYALPSTNPAAVGTLAYGIATGGAIGGLAGVFLGYGGGLLAPPSPPPGPPLPPSYYACTCTGGWSGPDCNTPPGHA